MRTHIIAAILLASASVAYAQETEVIDGLVTLVDAPDTPIEQLLKIVKGPDFPTRGYIYGAGGIREAYTTGRGTITLRAISCRVDVRIQVAGFRPSGGSPVPHAAASPREHQGRQQGSCGAAAHWHLRSHRQEARGGERPVVGTDRSG